MTVAYESRGVTLHHGDCLDVMRGMRKSSISAIVTDPPAGISFMGKDWDHHKGGRDAWVAWLADIMCEAYRVAKPGAHVAMWALPRTAHWTATALEDSGWEIRDRITHIFATGFPKSLDVGNGWGTALKPASEDWIIARKPLEGTVAANIQAHGTGAINIDACRVPGTLDGDPRRFAATDGGSFNAFSDHAPVVRSNGRWPSNLVLSHADDCVEECVEDCPVAELDAQSGNLPGSPAGVFTTIKRATGQIYGRGQGISKVGRDVFGYGGDGGASRFFTTFRYQAKAPTRERPTHNGVSHPTVKPLALMQWLVRLLTPPGGIVLDPFAGSGATVEACLIEGFGCVAIENEPSYLPLIVQRVIRH